MQGLQASTTLPVPPRLVPYVVALKLWQAAKRSGPEQVTSLVQTGCGLDLRQAPEPGFLAGMWEASALEAGRPSQGQVQESVTDHGA